MKIAVTYDNGQIFQHFGRTEQFCIYDVQDGVVTEKTVVPTNGTGHGALAGFLKESDERLTSLKRNTEGKRGGRGGRRS